MLGCAYRGFRANVGTGRAMRGVQINYGDFVEGAKESFAIAVSNSLYPTEQQLSKYDLSPMRYANPCEMYYTLLDGNTSPITSDIVRTDIGVWSEQISGADGVFLSPVTVTLVSDTAFTTSGFEFVFDTANDIYALDVGISWYSGDTLISQMDFAPDAAEYSCEHPVEGFDKVVIEFRKINMPFNRLRLQEINYGTGVMFVGDEITNVKVVQELSPISTELGINTVDVTLKTKRGTNYDFKKRQKIDVFFNGERIETAFVKRAKRTGRGVWNISADDYIGFMEDADFYGGVYNSKNAGELFDEIAESARVSILVQDDLRELTVSGYIPYTTCREALMLLAFSVGAVVDTSAAESVRVYTLSVEPTQLVTLDRVLLGQTFTDGDAVREVQLYLHSYEPIEDGAKLYDASQDGVGDDILLRFSEPMHDLSFTGTGSIMQSGANYAIINAGADFVLSGKKYRHIENIRRRTAGITTEQDNIKIVSIRSATLRSDTNIDRVFDLCYNELTKVDKANMQIVERQKKVQHKAVYAYAKYGEVMYGQDDEPTYIGDASVNVGDVIQMETGYLGVKQGRVTRLSYSLSSGTLVKDAEVVL